jgi:hypothetical protein
MRFDLRQQALSCFDDLPALGRQRSDSTNLFVWECAPRIGAESHETRSEFRIDPVGFGTRAPAGREGLDLGGRQLPCRDACAFKHGPQSPFLSAGCLESG